MRKALVFLILVSIFWNSEVICQSGYRYEKELVSKIVITDKKIINRMLMDMLIPETDVEGVEIFDIDGSGPNIGDLMRVIPSNKVYSIDMLTKETSDILRGIPPDPNKSKTGLTKIIGRTKPNSAEDQILYILGKAISQLYATDAPIQVYFEQYGDGTFKFNLYGFEREKFDQDAQVAFGKVTESKVQDLLKALYQEFSSEYKGFQPTVVRIREVIKDTVYVPIYKKGGGD